MEALTSNKQQGIIAARKMLVGYRQFISKGKLAHPDMEEFGDIDILRDTGASQSLLTRNCLPRGRNWAVRKRVYISGIENKLKDVPIYQIKLHSEIMSDTVDIGIVEELPMRGTYLFQRNNCIAIYR